VSAIIESGESPRNESDRLPDFSRESSSEIASIRRRLRHWEVENPTHPILDSHSQDLLKTTAFRSTLLQVEDDRTFGEDEDENGTSETPQPLFGGAELVDFGKQRTFLRRGDLVELRYSNYRFLLPFLFSHLAAAVDSLLQGYRWCGGRTCDFHKAIR
jgi:hypothetical protein